MLSQGQGGVSCSARPSDPRTPSCLVLTTQQVQGQAVPPGCLQLTLPWAGCSRGLQLGSE